MIGDRQEVERPALELHLEAGRVLDRLALGVPVGVVGRRAHVEDEGVERVAGVDVEVAEVGLARGGAGWAAAGAAAGSGAASGAFSPGAQADRQRDGDGGRARSRPVR